MQSGYFGPFLRTSIDWLRSYVTGSPTFAHPTPNGLHVLTLIWAGLGAVLVFAWYKLEPLWAAFLAWGALYVLGYIVLDIPFYTWYAVPLILVLSVLQASDLKQLADQGVTCS